MTTSGNLWRNYLIALIETNWTHDFMSTGENHLILRVISKKKNYEETCSIFSHSNGFSGVKSIFLQF